MWSSRCIGPVLVQTALTMLLFIPPVPSPLQLAQDQVLGWIWANGVDQAVTEAAVQQQIDNQINPPVVTPPLPWATPAA
jgi:hypothetical protein